MPWIAIALALTLGQPPSPPQADASAEGTDVTWQLSGPGGGGWIQSIAWDAQVAETLYVGCDVGGFYVSTDAGRQYTLRNHGLRDYFLETLAVHPTDRRIVLIGTESGIHRSADQGRTWQWIRDGFPPVQGHAFSSPIGAIAFDPLRPSVVYAGVGRPRWNKGGAGAVYRSDDTGVTWRLVSAGQLPADAIIGDIELQPGQSQTLLVATQHGVFRSDDAGKTWTRSSDGLPQPNVEELAFATSAPNVVYASLCTTARDKQPFNGGVCRSDDAGRTWRVVNGPGMPRRVGASNQNRAMTTQIKELVVDPRNADVVYAGDQAWVTAGVYKTEDGGKHWRRATATKGDAKNMDYGWITTWGPSVECMAISPARPDRLAFGTSGHVFVTDDGGRTWQQRYSRPLPDGHFTGNGLEVTCLFQVIPDPVRAERLWYCYMDIGLLVSDDSGASFRRSFQGMKHAANCFTVLVDPQSPSTVWAGTGQWGSNIGDVCRSTDGGQSWQVVGKPETGLPVGQTRHLVLDPKSPVDRRRLLVTSRENGLYESRDGGQSWQAINGNLPPAAVKQPRALLLDPRDSKHLTVALNGSPEKGGGVYATHDAGRSWQRLKQEPQFAEITSLVADPRNADTLYLTSRQQYDHQTRRMYQGGLFASTDGGRQWQRMLDFRFVSAVAVSPADSRTLYVTTTDHAYHDDYRAPGLLKSRDGGKTWRRENSGLSHSNLTCLSINPHDPSTLYVGSSGNSVFIGKDEKITTEARRTPSSRSR